MVLKARTEVEDAKKITDVKLREDKLRDAAKKIADNYRDMKKENEKIIREAAKVYQTCAEFVTEDVKKRFADYFQKFAEQRAKAQAERDAANTEVKEAFNKIMKEFRDKVETERKPVEELLKKIKETTDVALRTQLISQLATIKAKVVGYIGELRVQITNLWTKYAEILKEDNRFFGWVTSEVAKLNQFSNMVDNGTKPVARVLQTSTSYTGGVSVSNTDPVAAELPTAEDKAPVVDTQAPALSNAAFGSITRIFAVAIAMVAFFY